jgi:NitT/TauT family transport system ATP-binding protein
MTGDDGAAEVLGLTDVGLRYDTGIQAVDRISLRLRAGEFVSVVGPSGCGKSTLLRLAAGLLAPTDGVVDRHTDRVGFVFQDPTLLPWRTVRRNVELIGELEGLSRQDRRTRAVKAIGRVGLAEFAEHRPGALSGGMRMRVSLARTLTVQPDLFLFDEPFGALDEITRTRLGDDLQALFAADRFTALFVTHSLAEAVYLAGRVLVMSDRPGQIVGEVDVPIPYPRPPELRYTTEFAELTARVSHLRRAVPEVAVMSSPVTSPDSL